jgi:hypothetical protein
MPTADETTIDGRLVACLVVESGTPAKQVFRLGQTTGIGRADDNDIVLDDPRLSRYHATVTQEDSVYTIADLGSTNGTFRNEKRVSTPQVLKEGDRIRVGQVTLAFRRLPAAVEAHASATYESPPTVMAPMPPASAAASASAQPQVQSTPGSWATGSPIRWLVVGILAALLLCMLVGAVLFYALGGPDLDLPVLWGQATSTPEPIVVTESPVIPAVTVVVTNSPEPIVTVVVTNTPEPTP